MPAVAKDDKKKKRRKYAKPKITKHGQLPQAALARSY